MERGDEAAAEVAAMQFAGGLAVAEVAARWDRDAEWVEAAVRRALLEHIPHREGGLKLSRTEARAARSEERAAASNMQLCLLEVTLDADGEGYEEGERDGHACVAEDVEKEMKQAHKQDYRRGERAA